MKFRIGLSSLAIMGSFCAHSFVVPEENIFITNGVNKRAVVRFEEGKFSTSADGKTYQVQSYDVSGLPSTLTEDQLKGFLGYGYLSLKQVGDEYKIEGIIRALGGGGDEEENCLRSFFVGMMGGAGVGAVTGTWIFPGVGTAPGAVIGGVVSAFTETSKCKQRVRDQKEFQGLLKRLHENK